jgi:hypothetical protein
MGSPTLLARGGIFHDWLPHNGTMSKYRRALGDYYDQETCRSRSATLDAATERLIQYPTVRLSLSWAIPIAVLILIMLVSYCQKQILSDKPGECHAKEHAYPYNIKYTYFL